MSYAFIQPEIQIWNSMAIVCRRVGAFEKHRRRTGCSGKVRDGKETPALFSKDMMGTWLQDTGEYTSGLWVIPFCVSLTLAPFPGDHHPAKGGTGVQLARG